MTKNISGTERIFRILVGLILLAFAISGRTGAWAGWFGLALLLTGSVSLCPLYGLLGFNRDKAGSGG